MTSLRLPRLAAWAGVVFWLGSGAWAFLAPRSFYESIATFDPYNEHFLHDLGAFSIGLAAVLLFALLTRWDTLRVALAGIAVASVIHVIAHAIDSDIGGRDTDVPGLIVVALVFIAGAAAGVPRREEVRTR